MAKSAVILVVIAMVLCVNAVPVPQGFDPFAMVQDMMTKSGLGGINAMMTSNTPSGSGVTNSVIVSSIKELGKPAVTNVMATDGKTVMKSTYIGDQLVKNNQ